MMFDFDGQTSGDRWRLNRWEITHDVAQHEGNWVAHDHGNQVAQYLGNWLAQVGGNSTSNISLGSNIPMTSEINCRAKNIGGGVELPVLKEIIGGTSIVVCGAELEKKNPEDRIFSEFSIKSVNSNGILSKSLMSVGARDTYHFSKQDDALQIDEVVPTKNAWWPVFRSSLTCKKK